MSKTKDPWVLGISASHNGAVCLLKGDEIVVANDGGDSILFFPRTANGDVAPSRILQGPDTGLKNPAGVVVDVRHDEL